MLQENPADSGLTGGLPEASQVPDPRSRRVYRFGGFELRSETGELSKNGVRVKVQAKPIQVLEALLARPGELVTREELCKKLWPAGTFVDFENGLNTATNRLRAALCDSAEAPRYIETLPRLGYRFICPVVEIDGDHPNPTKSDVAPPVDTGEFNLETGIPDLTSTDPASYKSHKFFHTALVMIVVLAVGVLASAYIRSKVVRTDRQPIFRQLTFRAGVIGSARFAPDQKNVVYTAKWGGGDRQTYLVDLDSSKSRVLGFAPGALASVSRQGDLAFVSRSVLSVDRPARLSRVSVHGGASQVIAEGAKAADWDPNGKELAIVREVGPESVIEFPVGKVVYSSQGWLNCLRVSPRGDQVAFLEHPVRDDDGGHVRVVDKKGNTRVLTDEWSTAEGLAWSPSGKEILFTACKTGAARVLYEASTTAKLRQISNTPSSLRLLDISRAGRVLIAVDDVRMTMTGAPGLGRPESDLSKFDLSHVDDISVDGNLVLFSEGGAAGGQHYSTYVHDQKSGSTFRVASGRGLALSADAKWALTVDPQDRTSLTLTSIGSQQSRKVFGNGFEYQWARFLTDGKRLIVGGAYLGERLSICTQLLDGGKPVAINGAPYLDFVVVSPDGLRIAGATASNAGLVFDLDTHSARQISPGMSALPVAWSMDNKDLYSVNFRDSVYQIVKTNTQTGKVQLWKTLSFADQAGVLGLSALAIAPATGAYAYSTGLNLSRLYLVDGWL